MIDWLMNICHFREFGLNEMAFAFGAVAGLGWLLAYIDIVRLGFKQKTYGMPISALALNIVWEGMYAYLYWMHDGKFYGGYMMAFVNTAWFIADCLILYTHIKWGKEDFLRFAAEKFFWPWFALNMVMAIVVEVTWYMRYDVGANACTAIIQNIPMSMLYLFLLFERKSTKGQSMNIALGKMFGTLGALLAMIYFATLRDALNIGGGLICFMFDIVYCVLLYKQFKAEGKNPWFPSRPADPAKINLKNAPTYNPLSDGASPSEV